MKRALLSSALKVRAPLEAVRWAKRLKKKGRKIVFTNGCFDLIHPGHIAYLEEAARLGHELVVALNSDASVRRLKGPSRPINKLNDRARVMAGLGCVSCVTWFTQDTPEKIIRELSPEVLVKGGDWQPHQIVGADWVLKSGGKVFSLQFVKGRSTTKILEKISRRNGRKK
jgi:rfaE bifunctional protein nucleotidyltransferase chain/domain